MRKDLPEENPVKRKGDAVKWIENRTPSVVRYVDKYMAGSPYEYRVDYDPQASVLIENIFPCEFVYTWVRGAGLQESYQRRNDVQGNNKTQQKVECPCPYERVSDNAHWDFDVEDQIRERNVEVHYDCANGQSDEVEPPWPNDEKWPDNRTMECCESHSTRMIGKSSKYLSTTVPHQYISSPISLTNAYNPPLAITSKSTVKEEIS